MRMRNILDWVLLVYLLLILKWYGGGVDELFPRLPIVRLTL